LVQGQPEIERYGAAVELEDTLRPSGTHHARGVIQKDAGGIEQRRFADSPAGLQFLDYAFERHVLMGQVRSRPLADAGQ
jgi:hypothetical protein